MFNVHCAIFVRGAKTYKGVENWTRSPPHLAHKFTHLQPPHTVAHSIMGQAISITFDLVGESDVGAHVTILPRATIDINSVLGNHDGKFVWGKKDVTKSARDLTFDGKTLKAELRDVMGDWKAAEVDLTTHIRYNVEKNVMEAFDIPA
ncbi:hypothetical protein CALCODRAFT_521230 [Calocera cornea HHB12733]|uniref:Cyanovirin-N domain-containing protein n=1 Tax=Calocera cornea HHB12733 TaxID=1353952 RepID=A0A165CY12_9BASI|nr:hypothetical protein CALCODRAFT_521230 [Calocera cornea HHB12733]